MSKTLIASIAAMFVAAVAQPANADDVRYEHWSNSHPEWVQTHQKEHTYWMAHPEDAERDRSKWSQETRVNPGGTTTTTTFRSWANEHPDWVREHKDRYEFFVSHPDQAEQLRREWFGWNPGSTTTTTTTNSFQSWATEHPDWVRTHHDRYEFFVSHPEQAEQERREWFGWNPNSTTTTTTSSFQSWATEHPDWVRSHHDRYEFFVSHPDQAERDRHEWYSWNPNSTSTTTTTSFNSWATEHPDWVRSHRKRYQYFMAHPNAAQESRHEWYEYNQNGQQVQREFHQEQHDNNHDRDHDHEHN